MEKTWEQIAAEIDRRSRRAFVLAGVVLTAGIVAAAVAAGMVPAKAAATAADPGTNVAAGGAQVPPHS